MIEDAPDLKLDAMTRDQQLDYTQQLRLRIANQLAPYAIAPTDVKERRELMGVLESIDGQVFARKAAEDSAKNAGANERVASFLAELHSIGGKDLHRVDTPVMRDVSPDLSAFMDKSEVTEFMISQEEGAGDSNFAEFSEEFKRQNPIYQD